MLHSAALVPSGTLRVAERSAVDRHQRLTAMLQQHFRLVWRTVRRLGVPEAGCDDAAQHVFIVAADRLEQIQPGKERAFLLGTACRVAANVRRARARHAEVHDDERMAREENPAPDPEQLLQMKQMRVLLDELLARLTDDLRTVFVLFELERLSSVEIAELLDIPVGTVASRLRRARAAFEAQVEELKSASKGGRP